MNGFSSNESSNKRMLEGKVAIVTGGASGIGASTVNLFWENGAKVVIADIQDELGEAVASKLGNHNVCYVHCDVSNEEDIANLIDTSVAKYGQLDIMYNNAGIFDMKISESIMDIKKSDLEKFLGVNLVGSLLGAKHAARVMVPRKKGCILFTASACASIAGIGPHSYAVSKHGIVGLTKNLAAEMGQHGIRVNCISPFGVLTQTGEQAEARYQKMANLKETVLRAKDVAKAALYLASDEASYVSGLNLVVDGGFSVVNPTIMNAIALGPSQ